MEQRVQEIDPYRYSQLVFDKESKAIPHKQDILFNNPAGILDVHMQKKK